MPRRTKNAIVAALENSIETHVAGRIRLRRGLLGMSQSDLARALGITFQQVQKYERGSNRVSVGKLYRLAEILDVPLTFFFDGLDLPDQRKPPQPGVATGEGAAPILSRRELDLLRAWKTARPEVADAVSSLLRSISPDAEEPAMAYAAPSRQVVVDTSGDDEPDAGAVENGPIDGEGLSETPVKRRRGRPKGSTNKPKVTAEAAGLDSDGRRRRRGAVWDPADITRASAPRGRPRR